MDSKKKFELNNNDEFLKKKINSKKNYNKDTFKETTIDSFDTSYKGINNNKRLNLSQTIQIGTLNTIDEKYDKYKNLENPFTIPDIPISPSKERRSKIIHRINQERMTYQSKSVDNAFYNKKKFKKRNSHLSGNLFDDNSDF